MFRVLIVEDNPFMADICQDYLQHMDDFTLVGVAPSGLEALQFLETNTVDLILLDVVMPNMNGLDFLTNLRKQEKPIDVIITSGTSDTLTINQALQRGAIDYLIKPYTFHRFADALSTYRARMQVIKSNHRLNQADVDKVLKRKKKTPVSQLPKGLSLTTLRQIIRHLPLDGSQSVSAEEIAGTVGISRVGARGYLEFLVQTGMLTLEKTFGAVGRPTNRYRCVNPSIFPLDEL